MKAKYCVVKISGSQEIARFGDTILADKIDGEVGDKISLTPLLVVQEDEKIVTDPKKLSSFPVEAQILDFKKGVKLYVMRYKNKSRQHRKIGYRSKFSLLKITKCGDK